MPYYPPATSGSTVTTKDDGVTLSSTVTTFDFTGAGVTASGAGATTTVNITGESGDIPLSLLAPSIDETITAGYSASVLRQFVVASGKKLTLGTGSRFRIL